MSTQRIALVTGGNRGIGLGIVEGLVKENYNVLLGSRDVKAGNLAIEYLEEKADNVKLVELDVSDENSIKNAVAWVEKEFGNLSLH